MRSQLKELKLQGFKSIQRLDLMLGDVNVFIGPNGSGKSNFVSFFRLLNALVRQNLQVHVQQSGQAESLLYYGPKVTDRIGSGLYFGHNGYEFELLPTEDGRLIFDHERMYFDGDSEKQWRTIGRGMNESSLPEKYEQDPSGIAGYVYPSIKTWRVYHFHDTGPKAPPKSACDLHENEFLHSDAGNIAAFLYLLQEKHPDHYDLIRESVRLIFPQFGDFALRPNPLQEEQIRLEWREPGSEYRFQAHQLSDGTLRFICLATLLLQPNPPTTIIVDEPELGLHPRALSVLAGLVDSASSRCQVILTTQSVTLLNQFNPQDIVVIDRKEEDRDEGDIGAIQFKSTFNRIRDRKDLSAWLEQYTIGELWEMNLIGGRP